MCWSGGFGCGLSWAGGLVWVVGLWWLLAVAVRVGGLWLWSVSRVVVGWLRG